MEADALILADVIEDRYLSNANTPKDLQQIGCKVDE
jgi:hypothetical protein